MTPSPGGKWERTASAGYRARPKTSCERIAFGPMSRATELTDVGQGLATAMLAIGVEAVTSSKMDLEFAFIHAWRDWPHARKFPTIRADHTRNDILGMLNGSARRKGSYLGFWEVGQWAYPMLRDGMDLADAADLMPKYTGVAWEDWLHFARLFAAEFTKDQILVSRT